MLIETRLAEDPRNWLVLDALRYWSHELQEPYASAEVAGARYAEARAKGLL